jgi:CheY-like chemotaxis protein
MPERMLDILLVEDDDVDIQTFRRHLDDPGIRLHIANDAMQAISILSNRSTLIPERKRWLVLLDLNLPGASGVDLLNYLRADLALQFIPVVIMSTSADERDIKQTFSRHISGYFIKPLEPMEFRRRLRAITHYWSESEMMS